jgi:putative ABC transport system permease protein
MVTLFLVGLLLPLSAALVPILNGVRRPIVDAFNPESLVPSFGGGWFDRLLGRIRALPRPTALALRSTFAHKGRLVMTLSTLLLAAAVVMAVFSAAHSLNRTVDEVGSWWVYDAYASLSRPAPQRELERLVLHIPEVEYAETWLDGRATLNRADGTENEGFWTIGIPYDTKILHLQYQEGSAPQPGDRAVIVTSELALAEDLHAGDTASLKINGSDIMRRVAAVVSGSLQGATLYLERDDLANLQSTPGSATRVLVQGTNGNLPLPRSAQVQDRAPLQERLARALDSRLTDKNLPVSGTQTAHAQLTTTGEQLGILTTFLTIMAGALAAVGVIGLSGSMTLTVMESTREIGIMRSVGASHGSIFGIYITQGLVVGTLSWLLGALLSWPLSWALVAALRATLGMHLAYAYSVPGAFITLALVWLISILGSLLPAWHAAQVSIRDAISYE